MKQILLKPDNLIVILLLFLSSFRIIQRVTISLNHIGIDNPQKLGVIITRFYMLKRHFSHDFAYLYDDCICKIKIGFPHQKIGE